MRGAAPPKRRPPAIRRARAPAPLATAGDPDVVLQLGTTRGDEALA
ncbi:protein of unassigned function [Methylobacterium oryzae CBMB20]|uniref:Protein of unassigned function n=1 Tax=Methylobacterium oryzae CBMB20 TaxID=693986 RepID=A0A089P277_9HYPH|nr:protein of unassigned function [Methylobacterium oryzae CBMB20]